MDGVTIECRDGSERTLGDVQTVEDIPTSAWDGAVTVTPSANVPSRQFSSTGGSGMGTEFSDMPAGTTVVTTVTRASVENSMLSLGAGTCGDADVIRAKVAVDATGSMHLHTACEGARVGWPRQPQSAFWMLAATCRAFSASSAET